MALAIVVRALCQEIPKRSEIGLVDELQQLGPSVVTRPLLAGLSTNLRQIQGSTTTDAQYQRALAQFRRRPDPPGQVLNWVCRDNLSYLDLTQNRLEMDPD